MPDFLEGDAVIYILQEIVRHSNIKSSKFYSQSGKRINLQSTQPKRAPFLQDFSDPVKLQAESMIFRNK
jgi:hypothetical protein